MTKRTARKDSNYIIYEAVSEAGENYIGLTRKGDVTIAKAVKERWRKHLSHIFFGVVLGFLVQQIYQASRVEAIGILNQIH